MNLAQLRELARADLDDRVEPYLWSDEDLDEFANDAHIEAARRARLLRDSTTTAVARITLVPDQSLYSLHASVVRVDRARIEGRAEPLAFVLLRDADRCLPGWEDYESATPTALIPDFQSGTIALVPAPAEAGTLHLTVIRTPLAEMNDDADEPEIPPHAHRALRHWMVFRAHLNPDSQKLDKKRAAEALALFEAEFGVPQPVYDEVWQQQHYAGRDYGHY